MGIFKVLYASKLILLTVTILICQILGLAILIMCVNFMSQAGLQVLRLQLVHKLIFYSLPRF